MVALALMQPDAGIGQQALKGSQAFWKTERMCLSTRSASALHHDQTASIMSAGVPADLQLTGYLHRVYNNQADATAPGSEASYIEGVARMMAMAYLRPRLARNPEHCGSSGDCDTEV